MATTFSGYGPVAPGQDTRDPATRPLRGFRVAAREDCGRSLASLVESEIIPRLLDVHPAMAGPADVAIAEADVEAFAPLALQVDADVLLDHAEALLARGLSVESLLVDLLAPAARVLGEYWKADRCDFVDVTMGLWRLQEIISTASARSWSRSCLRAAAGTPTAPPRRLSPSSTRGWGTSGSIWSD